MSAHENDNYNNNKSLLKVFYQSLFFPFLD